VVSKRTGRTPSGCNGWYWAASGSIHWPILIQKLVDSHCASLGSHVLGQHTPEQLLRPRRTTNDSTAFTVGEDRRVARCLAAHGGNPVQRVPTLEELKITWTQDKALDRVFVAASQHSADVIEVLRVRGSYVGTVLEEAANLRLLREQAYRELIRIKMPRVRQSASS
jgi:hypothetical protein